MPRWTPVARVADCPPGSSLEVVAEDRVLALFNVEGEIVAIDGVCPHQGGPLGKGRLNGCIVTCPWHGWQFNVNSGQHELNPSIAQAAFPTRRVGDTIEVDICD